MKVILIAPPIMDYFGTKLKPIAQDAGRNCPPYGMYLLTSLLREHEYDVILLDLIAKGTNNILQFKELFNTADLVGIGATSLSWPTANNVIKQVKLLNPAVKIVLGGIHPTMFDKYLLERFPIDFVIRGEGEIALPALCKAIEINEGFKDVPNLSWKSNNTIIRNKLGPLIQLSQLAKYSLPAYDLLPDNIYKGLSIESSRGCAFDCSFCSTSYRRTWRCLTPETFVNRLESLLPYVSKTKFHGTHIVDDEFSTDPKRVIEIINRIDKKGLKLSLVFDSRANDLLYDGLVEIIAPYTNQLLIGAECGYDEGLQKIGKNTTCQKLEEAAKRLNQFGLANRANFSFILGLPWESIKEVRKTIEFAMHLFSEYGIKILLQHYCLIPGSRLWQEDRENMILTEAMYDDFGFFRNLHFWYRSKIGTPDEVWELNEIIEQMKWLAQLAYPNAKMIEHATPNPLAKFFPLNIIDSDYYNSIGLTSLREVSKPII